MGRWGDGSVLVRSGWLEAESSRRVVVVTFVVQIQRESFHSRPKVVGSLA